jgi:hypothetical protein
MPIFLTMIYLKLFLTTRSSGLPIRVLPLIKQPQVGRVNLILTFFLGILFRTSPDLIVIIFLVSLTTHPEIPEYGPELRM